MEVANYLSTRPKNARLSEIFRASFAHLKERLWQTFTILLLVASLCGSAKAQYLGFAANSVDGTVSVFAVATSGPSSAPNTTLSGNQDHLVATILVGKNPTRIAVTPSPNLNRAYVTNTGDNSLWVIDVTNISQEGVSPGSITAQNVNPASDQLQLFQPGGIAIAAVTQGANNGKVLAFVANQGTNTVSVIDTGNNTLFGTVRLGPAGSSTTLPEVAATADGQQVFVANNSTAYCLSASTTPCPGVWIIDATSVTNGSAATPIQQNSAGQPVPLTGSDPLASNATVTLVQPRGISASQFSDTNGRHGVLAIADNGNHTDGAKTGYVFVVVGGNLGTSTAVEIPNNPGQAAATPIAVSAAFPLGASLSVDVVDSTLNSLWLLSAFNTTSGSVTGPQPLSNTPTSVAVTPDGSFAYIMEALGTQPTGTQLVENQPTANGPVLCLACGNPTTLSAIGTSVIFTSLDKDSPPVVWFIPAVSGGIDIPAVVPSDSIQSALAAGIVGNGQSIQTTLNFGDSNCTLFRNGAPLPTSPPNCTAPANSGTNAIGGGTIFPASGVFTVQVTETSTDSRNNLTQGIARGTVAVVAPTIIAPGESAVVPVSFAVGLSNVTLSTSCSVSPAGGPACSVSPAILPLSSKGTGTVFVTVTANRSNTALVVPRGDDWPGLPLALLIVLIALGLVFLLTCFSRGPVRKRPRWGLALLLLTSIIMLATGACTTVQRSNLGCTNCTATGSYMVTLSAKSVKPPLQTSGVFTILVTH